MTSLDVEALFTNVPSNETDESLLVSYLNLKR